MVQSRNLLFPIVSLFTISIGLIFLFKSELSSDMVLYEYLAREPLCILKGDCYDPAINSWAPMFPLLILILAPFKGTYLSIFVRVLWSLVMYLFLKKYKLGPKYLLSPFIIFPVFLLPQEDFLITIVFIYIYGKQKLRIFLPLISFFFLKIFFVPIAILIQSDPRTRLLGLLQVTIMLIYIGIQSSFGNILFVNESINSEVFVENSVNLVSSLFYLGVDINYLRFFSGFIMLFCMIFAIFIENARKRIMTYLIFFFAFFYYWSPEYLIWFLIPIVIFPEKGSRTFVYLYIVSSIAWCYNSLRGLVVRDVIDLNYYVLNVICGGVLFFILILWYNWQFKSDEDRCLHLDTGR